jgi:hypothetical protein
VIAGAGAGSPVKSRDRAAKSWGRSDCRPWGCACVCSRPPASRFLIRPSGHGPVFSAGPLVHRTPPQSQKRIYQRFFPGSLGENDVPGSSGTPGVAAQAQARALLPFSSSGSLTPGQQTAARLSAAPTTGSVRRCGFPLARQGRVLFFSSGQKGLGAPQIAQTPAWLLGCDYHFCWPEPSCTGF